MKIAKGAVLEKFGLDKELHDEITINCWRKNIKLEDGTTGNGAKEVVFGIRKLNVGDILDIEDYSSHIEMEYEVSANETKIKDYRGVTEAVKIAEMIAKRLFPVQSLDDLCNVPSNISIEVEDKIVEIKGLNVAEVYAIFDKDTYVADEVVKGNTVKKKIKTNSAETARMLLSKSNYQLNDFKKTASIFAIIEKVKEVVFVEPIAVLNEYFLEAENESQA